MQARLNAGMETLAKRTRYARTRLGLTQAEVADLAGMKQPDISKIERGEILRTTGLLGLARALKCNANWLDTGDGDPGFDAPQEASNVTPGPDIRGTVPLLSSVQAGAFKEFLDSEYSGGSGVVMIPTTVPVNRYTFALRVQGDSMEPRFTEGMLLIVEPELDAQHGDFVIVKNGSEETTFKQLVKDGSDWFIKPLNPRYPIKPLGSCTIIGVVRGVTEQFR